MKRRWLAALFALLLIPGLLVFARDTEEYRTIPSVPSTYRTTALDGNDSLDFTAPLDTAGADISVKATAGNPNVAVSARFSAASATSTIYCALWHFDGDSTYTFLGIADALTATGAATATDSGGAFPMEQLLLFDTAGATHYELRITDPSTGTLELKPWLFGSLTGEN